MTSSGLGQYLVIVDKMAAMVNEGEFYHRRIDRSPEKQEFRRLPSDDRHLISNLRSVMGSARDRVTKLRDELDDKYGKHNFFP